MTKFVAGSDAFFTELLDSIKYHSPWQRVYADVRFADLGTKYSLA